MTTHGIDPEFLASEYDEQWSRLSDYVKHNPGARHRRRLIAEAATHLDGPVGAILDVGCGLGEVIIDLKRLYPAAEIVGLDISTVAIERCRAAFPDAEFHLANISDDALDRRFDLIVCSEVTEHLSDPPRAIVNMRKMTKGGGSLVITTPHGRIHPTELAIGHLKHPSRAELVEWLCDAGFTIVRIRQWGWPGYTILKYLANLAPKAAMRHLGHGAYSQRVRRLNHLAFLLTRWLSVPSSPWGPQFVATARAID